MLIPAQACVPLVCVWQGKSYLVSFNANMELFAMDYAFQTGKIQSCFWTYLA